MFSYFRKKDIHSMERSFSEDLKGTCNVFLFRIKQIYNENSLYGGSF